MWTPGTIAAVGFRDGKEVCRHELTTAGPAAAVRLTPITGPGGLRADGADVALFDVEVTDTAGRRCPTDEARVDFTLTGPAGWRGGYNSRVVDSVNNTWLNTECGINRVAVRSTPTAGPITLTARRDGLKTATVTIRSVPATASAANDGLPVAAPRRGLTPAAD